MDNDLIDERVLDPTLNVTEILQSIRFQEPDALATEIGGRRDVIDLLIAE